MGQYHFEPAVDGATDEVSTEILITDAGSINTDVVEKRPVISVSRGPFAYGNTSIDQLLKKDPGLASNKRVHTDLLSGSFVINCVSRSGLEAEEIALIVAKGIRYFRRQLQKAGFFHIGTLVQVGGESAAGTLVAGDSAEDFIVVPVSFPVYYQESWTVEENAPLLNTLRAQVNFVAKQFDGSLLNPESVDEEGNPIPGEDGIMINVWTIST